MLGVGDDLHTDLQTSLGYRVRREMIKTQPEQSHSLPHDDYGPDYLRRHIFLFILVHHTVTDGAERNVMSVRVSFRVSRGSKPIWWMTERTVMKGTKTALGEASPVE